VVEEDSTAVDTEGGNGLVEFLPWVEVGSVGGKVLPEDLPELSKVVPLGRGMGGKLIPISGMRGEEVGEASHKDGSVGLRTVLLLEGSKCLDDVLEVKEQLRFLYPLLAV
jgi:hypothetical protein